MEDSYFHGISLASELVMPPESLNPKIHALHRIYQSLVCGDQFIPIFTQLKLTKSNMAYCEAMLVRDHYLERSTFQLLNSRSAEDQVYQRYSQFLQGPQLIQRPQHYAAKILSGRGAICSGENIFLFFPECLEIPAEQAQKFFGIELIDVWANIFQKNVFPCVRRVFDFKTQINIITKLMPVLEETIYLASVFHEIGHQVGAWGVSPQKNPKNLVNSFHLDIMGELQTDCWLIKFIPEFDEVFFFVLLQRLFWFGRRGFASHPQAARINQDNDSLISALLWNVLTAQKAIKPVNATFILDIPRAKSAMVSLSTEIESLGQQAFKLPVPAEQDEIISSWLKSKISYNEVDGFILSETQKQAFSLCLGIEEIPMFLPMMDYQHLGDIYESTKIVNY